MTEVGYVACHRPGRELGQLKSDQHENTITEEERSQKVTKQCQKSAEEPRNCGFLHGVQIFPDLVPHWFKTKVVLANKFGQLVLPTIFRTGFCNPEIEEPLKGHPSSPVNNKPHRRTSDQWSLESQGWEEAWGNIW